jgi:hypothetical protein
LIEKGKAVKANLRLWVEQKAAVEGRKQGGEHGKFQDGQSSKDRQKEAKAQVSSQEFTKRP